jgi:tetratricopeptide (TPR) repeat protein
MEQIEKTVFLSYRRTNIPWALAISQSLTNHGYDVFFDFNGIASGDFEAVILANIRARAHFLVLLTPSALERCNEQGDWLRREIEVALGNKRNIVPLLLEGFDFGAAEIAGELTGQLSRLRQYNALRVHADYFGEAMDRLRAKYLNVALDAVLHPASSTAARVAREEQAAAAAAPPVTERELTAQEWFERGLKESNLDEKLRFFTEAISLKPDHVYALNARGKVRKDKGDLGGALQDYSEAILLKPDSSAAYRGRADVRKRQGDLEGALQDYSDAIRLKPDYPPAYYGRALVWRKKKDPEAAVIDFQKYLDLGGGERDGDTAEVEQMIQDLKKKL